MLSSGTNSAADKIRKDPAQMPPKSKAQARLFGAIAGGRSTKSNMTRSQAKEALRGSKLKKLPARKRSKKRSK